MTQPAKKKYFSETQEKIAGEFLRNKLKLKNAEAKDSFYGKYPHVKKFFDDRSLDLENIRQHSARVISAGALAGTLLLAPPIGINIPNLNIEISKNLEESLQKTFLNMLRNILPSSVGPLTRSQEKNLEKMIEKITGVKTRATLEGEHLNTTYGYIGAEQHLMRYPGDSMATHPKVAEDDEGMAPGRGAWGYVNDTETEKWYAVVQTLYLPDWDSRVRYLREWYKYRKVLIVNTNNGNAVVAAIADAGPAAWTGKQFGGSPEVMNYLGGARYKKGPVLVFFVDDPENKIPLGPVDYNVTNLPESSLVEI